MSIPFMTRRTFIGSATGATLAAYTLGSSFGRTDFRLWAMGCAHISSDLLHGRESLAEAIKQSEGATIAPSFEWDIALHLGDLSGYYETPKDKEGQEVVRQFSATQKHRREDFYTLIGNHDSTRFGEPTQWWYRKWVDPFGENTATSGVDASRRPCPIQGTWERYSLRLGNLLFLILSDRNDLEPPVGRVAHSSNPAGAVTSETFQWWKNMVESNPDSIIVTAHHHMLRETTVASGPWEGFCRKNGKWQFKYHVHRPKGAPKGASYLYWLDDQPDAQAFEQYLASHPNAIDLWLGGHTHCRPGDRTSGRTHVERKWGVTFVNCAPLSRFHTPGASTPMSRLFTFTEGSDKARVQCYLHTFPFGWHDKSERVIPLSKPFHA